MRHPSKEYIFVIHTNSYAGNFEREMTAFCTGIVGECGVGQKQADDFHQSLKEGEHVIDDDFDSDSPFAGSVQMKSDDHGCLRPTAIWPNPNYYNDGLGNLIKGYKEGAYPAYNSVAIFFEKLPTPEEQQTIFERVALFESSREDLTIEGFEIFEVTTTESKVAGWQGIPGCVEHPNIESYTKRDDQLPKKAEV